MIIEIALGIVLAYVLIATMEFWLPFLIWVILGLIGLVVALVIVT